MPNQRLLQWIPRVTLVALVIVGFNSGHSEPRSGDWKVSTSFGEFTITVSAGGSSITQIKYSLTGLSCGGSTYSGGITSTSSWSITNNQFSIVTNLNPMSTGQTLTINGTFTPAGDQMSGTWSANIKGTICSGSWGPVGPVVSVDEAGGVLRRFVLAQNYPNPFNPSTTIKYELPQSSEVRLSVYDMLGREVYVLVNEKRDAGYHEVRFNGSNLASGVYLYRLQAGDFIKSKRLMLLK